MNFEDRYGILRVACTVLLAATHAGAHELTVPESDEPDAARVPVVHEHVCTRKQIELPAPIPRPDGDQVVAVVTHRAAWPETRRQFWDALGRAWAAASATRSFSSPPDRGKNCHGETFDAGRSWIDDPEPFLRRCTEVPRDQARVGDVVIYRKAGEIQHSARITEIREEAGRRTIRVHSEFGGGGDFDHEIDDAPKGGVFEFEHPPGTKRRMPLPDYGEPKVFRCP